MPHPATHDPRSSRRYTDTRRLWLAGYGGQDATCCMCGRPVDTSLPGTHPMGPTIEHRYPVRMILAEARDDAHAVEMACDTSWWAVAHSRCQSRQGQAVTSQINRARNGDRRVAGASRVW